jgi:hypothetical protein
MGSRVSPDDSPHSNAEVKNKWNYTTILPTSLHGMYMDNITFIIIFYLSSLPPQ